MLKYSEVSWNSIRLFYLFATASNKFVTERCKNNFLKQNSVDVGNSTKKTVFTKFAFFSRDKVQLMNTDANDNMSFMFNINNIVIRDGTHMQRPQIGLCWSFSWLVFAETSNKHYSLFHLSKMFACLELVSFRFLIALVLSFCSNI